MAKARIPLVERFMAKATPCPITGCWWWTGALFDNGYGVLWDPDWENGRGGNRRAHRVSFELFVGPLSDGLLICHRCDQPSCVNPEHLFLGTVQENSDDMVQKRRSAAEGRNAKAKLTANDVDEIRALSRRGLPNIAIAPLFGVSDVMVSYIVHGKNWRSAALAA